MPPRSKSKKIVAVKRGRKPGRKPGVKAKTDAEAVTASLSDSLNALMAQVSSSPGNLFDNIGERVSAIKSIREILLPEFGLDSLHPGVTQNLAALAALLTRDLCGLTFNYLKARGEDVSALVHGAKIAPQPANGEELQAYMRGPDGTGVFPTETPV